MRYIAFILAIALVLALPLAAVEDCTAEKLTLLLLPRSGVSLSDAAAQAGAAVDDFALTEAGATTRATADDLLDTILARAEGTVHCFAVTARWTAALVGAAIEVDAADLPALRAAGDLAPDGLRFDVMRPVHYLALEETAPAAVDAPTVTPPLTVDVTASPLPAAGDGTVIAILDGGFDPDAAWLTLPEGASPALVGEARAARLALLDRAPLEAGQPVDKVPFLYNYNAPGKALSGDFAHGAAVAALAAARTGDEYDGSAPGAQLLLMQVFGELIAAGTDEDILLSAIDDALLLGADVLNLSLGFPSGDGGEGIALARALTAATACGVGVVAAAGNFGELGGGSFFTERSGQNDFPTAHPDRGTVASPASLPGVIAVGAASGSYTIPNELYLADGTTIPYTDTCADFFVGVDSGVGRSFAELMGSGTLQYVAVPGVGSAADYVGLNLTGRIALVRRGELEFAEKTRHAADAGAIGVIVYDNDPTTDGQLNMQLEHAVLPAVFIGIAAGEQMAKAGQGSFTLPARAASARGLAPTGIAAFSSRGMTDAFTLAPHLVAPGEDFVGLAADGGFALLEGSSYAAPQVAGGLAALIGALRADGAADPLGEAKLLLQNAASPLVTVNAAGETPVSVRAQGAGILDLDAALASPLLLRGNDGGAVTLTGASDRFTLDFTLENRTDLPLPVVLTTAAFADAYRDPLAEEAPASRTEATEQWLALCGYDRSAANLCTDGELVPLEAAILLRGLDIAKTGAAITLAPGEVRALQLTVVLAPEVYAAYAAAFPNGFPVEGRVTATLGEETALALPWAAFCGDWSAAPMVTPTAYTRETQLYIGQTLVAPMRSGVELELGRLHGGDVMREQVQYSTTLSSFNPDALTRPLELGLCLVRNVARHSISVTNAAGEVVYTAEGGALRKTYIYGGAPVTTVLPLWDGSVTDNPRYHCPDGQYTIALTLCGEAGGEQILELGVTIDTTDPVLDSATLRRDGNDILLDLTFHDADHVRLVQLADRRNEVAYDYGTLVSEPVLAAGRGASHTLTIDAMAMQYRYLYVTLVDYAYNVHVVRLDRAMMLDEMG